MGLEFDWSAVKTCFRGLLDLVGAFFDWTDWLGLVGWIGSVGTAGAWRIESEEAFSSTDGAAMGAEVVGCTTCSSEGTGAWEVVREGRSVVVGCTTCSPEGTGAWEVGREGKSVGEGRGTGF